MTEMTPVGSFCRLPASLERPRSRNSIATAPGRACRCRLSRSARAARTASSRGTAQTLGELEVRGPWVRRATTMRTERRSVLRRRLVQDRRHRPIDPSGCIELADRSEGSGQVRRRVDQFGRARRRADGTSGGRRGRRHCRAASEWDERPLAVVVLKAGQHGDAPRISGVSRAAVREMVAAGRR